MRARSCRPRTPLRRLVAAAILTALAALGADGVLGADCVTPNQTTFGIPDANVQRLATTDVTSTVVDADVVVPVAALIAGGSRAVVVPFTFSGANRAFRVTVAHPAQTFPGGMPRYVGLTELVGDAAQCDRENPFAPVNRNTLFVSPYTVNLPESSGQVTFETKLRGGRTYGVELVYIFEKVEAGRTETFHVRVEALGGGGGGTAPPPTIPVIQPFFAGCTRTAKEYLDEALTIEETARATMLDDRIELEIAANAVASAPGDARLERALTKRRLAVQARADGVRAQFRTSKLLLACAREKVAADEGIPADDRAFVLAKIDEASARDDDALAHLNDPAFNSTVSANVVFELNRALEDALAAIVAKRSAGRTLDAAIQLGLEKAAAAEAAGRLVAEAVQNLAAALRDIGQFVKSGAATPNDVADAQSADSIGRTADELRSGVATTRGAAIAHVHGVTATTDDARVKRAAAQTVARIHKAGDRHDRQAAAVADRAPELAQETPAEERARYARNARFLESRLVLIGLGKVRGEVKNGAYYQYVLSEVNRFRRLAGLPRITNL